METGFKVGDRVRVVDGSDEFHGAVGTVMAGSAWSVWWVKVHGDGMYDFEDEELEPVTEDSDVQGGG